MAYCPNSNAADSYAFQQGLEEQRDQAREDLQQELFDEIDQAAGKHPLLKKFIDYANDQLHDFLAAIAEEEIK